MSQAREHRSADGRFAIAHCGPVIQGVGQTRESAHAENRELQQQCGDEQKSNRRNLFCQRRGDARAEDPAQSRCRGDYTEEPLALIGVEYVDHHRPEHRNHEQIENRGPDKKRATDPDVLLGAGPMQCHGKKQQIGSKETVADRDEFHSRQARHQRGERRIDGQHADERSGKQPLEIFDAAGDAHLVADGTENVIGKKYGEDKQPRPREGAHLRRTHVNQYARASGEIRARRRTPACDSGLTALSLARESLLEGHP